jgi:hypothetical protein
VKAVFYKKPILFACLIHFYYILYGLLYVYLGINEIEALGLVRGTLLVIDRSVLPAFQV